jgi:hypothetical protein
MEDIQLATAQKAPADEGKMDIRKTQSNVPPLRTVGLPGEEKDKKVS